MNNANVVSSRSDLDWRLAGAGCAYDAVRVFAAHRRAIGSFGQPRCGWDTTHTPDCVRDAICTTFFDDL